MSWDGRILCDARSLPLANESVQCVVTSPPYWGGVRDYFVDGQIGLEREPVDYVAALLGCFREVRRVLMSDGTLWLNIGDVYAASGKGGGGISDKHRSWESIRERKGFRMPPAGYKMKDISLTPFMVAEALRRDGWYLRSTIIWSKPAAIEPPRLDRPSTSHEYLFLLAKSETYATRSPNEPWWFSTVWTIQPSSSVDHCATMPEELVRRCLISSTAPGDLVLDPFAGSGTVARVCEKLSRRWIGCDLGYQGLQAKRLLNLQRELV